MHFFDRFREALARYEHGVHEPGDPAENAAIKDAASALSVSFPSILVDFLLQWNGAFLFHDEVALFGVTGAHPELQGIVLEGDLLRVGTTARGGVFLDEKGHVIVRSEDEDEAWIEGSDLSRWLDVTMGREGQLYERDGEFREASYDGDELSLRVRRKRNQLALKADPFAPAWHEEAADLAVEAHQEDEAIAELREAAAAADRDATPSLDRASAPMRLRLGRLLLGGDPDAALSQLVRAGSSLEDPQQAAYAWAEAARAARSSASVLAEDYAARARTLAPDFASLQRAAAEHLVESGDIDAALDRLAVALAVDPLNPDLLRLAANTRARRSLRTV